MNVKTAIENRFSNRYFNDKKITQEELTTILDAGRLAPNGFGFEAWNFYYTQEKQDEFLAACYGQPFVKTSSLIVVLTSPTEEYIKNNKDYLIKKGIANYGDEEKANYVYDSVSRQDMTQYFREQTFIASSYMSLQATELNIGSTIMGGFEPDKVADILGIDQKDHKVNLVIAFGHSDHEQPKRHKRDFNDIVINLDK